MSCDPSREASLGVLDLLSSLGSFKFVGLGTGSTLVFFLDAARGLGVSWSVVVSSLDTAFRASSLGFRVLDSRCFDGLEVYVDGADEVDGAGRMIKGGGGALLGEKILAYSSPLNIFAISEDKIVEALGSKRPVPVEIVKDYALLVARAVERLGFKVEFRESRGKRGPVLSDWGGVIVDVHTGPMRDPESVDRSLREIPGVVETGIFHGLADYIVVGFRECGYKVLKFERKAGRHRS
ncbi:MAG: ribose 5-phosphate isomerase A [Thermoprotei archaeon]|nr:ribose 5-phosphate isomerase A [Thermoprotei archaeon]